METRRRKRQSEAERAEESAPVETRAQKAARLAKFPGASHPNHPHYSTQNPSAQNLLAQNTSAQTPNTKARRSQVPKLPKAEKPVPKTEAGLTRQILEEGFLDGQNTQDNLESLETLAASKPSVKAEVNPTAGPSLGVGPSVKGGADLGASEGLGLVAKLGRSRRKKQATAGKQSGEVGKAGPRTGIKVEEGQEGGEAGQAGVSAVEKGDLTGEAAKEVEKNKEEEMDRRTREALRRQMDDEYGEEVGLVIIAQQQI